MKKLLIVVFFIILFGASFSLAQVKTDTKTKTSLSGIDIKKEEYKNKATGTWTFITYNNQGDIPWFKLVIKKDGTYNIYKAYPADSNWGDVWCCGSWEIITGKYVNTGKRYYAIKLKRTTRQSTSMFIGGNETFVFNNDTTLLNGDVDDMVFKKGNKFPFEE